MIDVQAFADELFAAERDRKQIEAFSGARRSPRAMLTPSS